MVAHEVYALVHDETIRDVCVAYSYEDANRVARIVYGDTAFAVDCMQYVCERNDKYINGVFFKAEEVTNTQLALTEIYEGRNMTVKVFGYY